MKNMGKHMKKLMLHLESIERTKDKERDGDLLTDNYIRSIEHDYNDDKE